MNEHRTIVETALRELIDPEAGINVIDLGLLHDVHELAGSILVEMIPTTAGCPLLDALANGANALLEPCFPKPQGGSLLAPRCGVDAGSHQLTGVDACFTFA